MTLEPEQKSVYTKSLWVPTGFIPIVFDVKLARVDSIAIVALCLMALMADQAQSLRDKAVNMSS